MSEKEDFVRGALDATRNVYLDQLPPIFKEHYEKTGAIDWYMAGQIMTGKLLNEIKSKPLSTYANNNDMR